MKRGKYEYVGAWVKYALGKVSSFLKSHPLQKNRRITVFVFLSTFQPTSLPWKWFRLRLHCYTLTRSWFWNKICPKPNPGKWCDDVTKSLHLYQVPWKSSHFWKYWKKLFRNLAASYRTWNVTFCDENVTSHLFVTVPHSNPGPGFKKTKSKPFSGQKCRDSRWRA